MRGRVPYACGGHPPDKYRGRPQDDGIGGAGTGGQVTHSRRRHPTNKYGGCARWQDRAAHVWYYTRDQWAGVHIRYSCSWFTHLIHVLRVITTANYSTDKDRKSTRLNSSHV